MITRITMHIPKSMSRTTLTTLSLAILLLTSACTNTNTTPDAAAIATPAAAQSARATLEPGILATPLSATQLQQAVPALAERAKRIATALQTNPPVLLMGEPLSDALKQAQDLAIANPQMQKEMRDPVSNAPVRAEIMGVYPTRESDYTQATAACKQSQSCYRVEMYNYAFNYTMIAIVDASAKSVLAVNRIADAQPDISANLSKLATDIAVNSPEVAAALGYKPDAATAVMASFKTSLSQSRCERSRHLCVAPTFVKGESALWAIVDLTDGNLVGVRWTDLGRVGKPGVVTQKGLQNDFVTSQFCKKTNSLELDGWKMDYILTSSDGLRLSSVSYKGQPILDSAKLVDWHISYSRQDGFGYSDAVGCPVFSQAAVVAFGGPAVEEIKKDGAVIGFSFKQDYYSDLWPAPCNYFYRQAYEFYTDGRFRPIAVNLGRGCGNDGVYRPVLRLAFAGQQTFGAWDGSGWKDWATEQWQLQTASKPDANNNQYRLSNNGKGFYVEPGRGQFADGRGDAAFVYVTKQHADKDEGESDLVTIGPCCNNDFRQGPEKFIDPTPEPLANSQLVMWYVPQIKNDDRPGNEYCWSDSVLEAGVYVAKTYPCAAGPMFKPIQ